MLVRTPPPPQTGPFHLRNDETLPDVVFVISSDQAATQVLGYFTSASQGTVWPWYSFPANQDTWLWLNEQPGGTQFNDTAWPNPMYLTPVTSVPADPGAFTTAAYESTEWSGESLVPGAAPPPYYLIQAQYSTLDGVGFVQLSETTRRWYKSGGLYAAWTGTYMATPTYFLFTPGDPGSEERWVASQEAR